MLKSSCARIVASLRRSLHLCKVSATSIFFESLPYTVDPVSSLVDYDDLEKRAAVFMPKLIIAGASAYPREWDYKRMR